MRLFSVHMATISRQVRKLAGRWPSGRCALPNPVLLAPMSGVTDAPFRRMVAAQGAGLVISEMTACAALAGGKRDARAAGRGPGRGTACRPACRLRSALDGRRRTHCRKASALRSSTSTWAARPSTSPTASRGSALMRDLDHALTLIEAVVQAVEVPVTLKMRLGWDDGSRNAPELARRAERGRRRARHGAWPHALPIL